MKCVKLMYFLKNLLLCSEVWFQGRVNKNINFMTRRAGVLMLGHGHICHYSEYVLSSTLSIYSTSIAIVLRDYDAAFLYHR